jgi:hypothetical protein
LKQIVDFASATVMGGAVACNSLQAAGSVFTHRISSKLRREYCDLPGAFGGPRS